MNEKGLNQKDYLFPWIEKANLVFKPVIASPNDYALNIFELTEKFYPMCEYLLSIDGKTLTKKENETAVEFMGYYKKAVDYCEKECKG